MAKLQVRLHNASPMRLNAEFDCEAGELVALLGPSGSGKTSLLRAVAGLLRAPSLTGSVQAGSELWFDSAQGIHWTPQQRRVGLVFQSYALFPHLTAMENVASGASSQRASGLNPVKIAALFERLGLAGLELRRPAQLSGGQQQRVALARALMRVTPLDGDASPRAGVLLLDEPFSAVDEPTRQTLYRELAALRKDVSTPMVLVTHDLSEARRLADRVVILDAGQTLQSGPPAQVFASPRNARVADLVGIQNHFKGRFFKQAPGWGLLRWTDDKSSMSLDLQVRDKNRLKDGAAVSWVLAGEQVDVGRADALNDALSDEPVNRIACELVDVLSLGETSLCTLVPQALSGQRVTLNLSSAHLRSLKAGLGSTVLVNLPAQGVHIMPQRDEALTALAFRP
jgi:molybdate transport system ATP-binding protein